MEEIISKAEIAEALLKAGEHVGLGLPTERFRKAVDHVYEMVNKTANDYVSRKLVEASINLEAVCEGAETKV